MDLQELEQRLIAVENDLLAHPGVLGELPRPDVTWMKTLSAVLLAISVVVLLAGAVATPYAVVFVGIAAVLAPLEKLLDIYLTGASATAAATKAGAVATVAAVRHQAALAAVPGAPAQPSGRPPGVPMPPSPPGSLAELPPMPLHRQ